MFEFLKIIILTVGTDLKNAGNYDLKFSWVLDLKTEPVQFWPLFDHRPLERHSA